MKPHILFFLPLPPPHHGASVVSRQIMESRLINESFQCDFINGSVSRSIDEINHFNFHKVFRHAGIWCRLFSKLLTGRYDLCYLAITCHGTSFLKDAPFVLLCKLFCKRIVIHQHNKGMSGDIDRWPYRWLLPLCYKNAKVILLSWNLYDDVSRVVPKADVMICPNGIPVSAGLSKSHKAGGEDDVPRLLFLSNLIESKGVLVLLDALKLLKDRGFTFRCEFVGGESREIDAKVFEEEVRKRGLEEDVSYLGKKYGSEKEQCFEESDIFVFPTYYENECFPLVLLEAMSHHLPVVTTDEGGIRDIVEDGVNGLICRRRDPESLAQCIARLLDDNGLRTTLGENGFEKIQECFTDRRFEERMTDCLKAVIEGTGSRGLPEDE